MIGRNSLFAQVLHHISRIPSVTVGALLGAPCVAQAPSPVIVSQPGAAVPHPHSPQPGRSAGSGQGSAVPHPNVTQGISQGQFKTEASLFPAAISPAPCTHTRPRSTLKVSRHRINSSPCSTHNWPGPTRFARYAVGRPPRWADSFTSGCRALLRAAR